MTRRKQFQPKRLTSSGDEDDDEDKDRTTADNKQSTQADDKSLKPEDEQSTPAEDADGTTNHSPDDIDTTQEDSSDDVSQTSTDDTMQIDTTQQHGGLDLKTSDLDMKSQKGHDLDKPEADIEGSEHNESSKEDMSDSEEHPKSPDDVVGDNDSQSDIDTSSKNQMKREVDSDNSRDEEDVPKTPEKYLSDMADFKLEKETNTKDVKVKKELSEADIEREVKKELKEAVEIRIPKVRSKRELSECKWLNPGSMEKSEHRGSKRAETPPLQKLMRQEFSPMKKSDGLSSHSSAKKFKENSHPPGKEGFTSKLASVIIPSSNIGVSPKTASHPKQLLSPQSLANIRASSFPKSPFSASSLLSRSFPASQPAYHHNTSASSASENDQPLDLSKKSFSKSHHEPSKSHHESIRGRFKSSPSKAADSHNKHENGMSSASLQSLQQKFGGDFHLRGLRKPLNYMLYGPEIPALHQALLHSASMSLPHFPHPLSNGLPKYTPEKSRHRNSTPSPSSKVKSEEREISKPHKKEEATVASEKSIKREHLDKSDTDCEQGEDKQGENYTNHLCTCGKWFDGLYSLSLHLQETGHLPARNKSVSLMEYPKLVRGQDMWLNQESEQTRRILRCIQCGESFKTLPLLTVHMMKTQHYTKIVSSEHARRAHKCSAYCDKEQDKDCVFKCKVCQDTFPDMEGLANHMIMSGHHKKQSPRSSLAYSDMQFKKRKRYSFEEALHPFGNPSMAAMLEYKRQNLGGQVSPDLSIDDVDDSRITCENCGNKIETKQFVDHVRACLGQRLKEDVARLEKEKENLKKLERERKRFLSLVNRDECEKDEGKSSPVKKRKVEETSSKDTSDEDNIDNQTNIDKLADGMRVKLEKADSEDMGTVSEDKIVQDSVESKKMNLDLELEKLRRNSLNRDRDIGQGIKAVRRSDSDSELEDGEVTNKSKNILKEIQTLVDSKGPSVDVKHEMDKTSDTCGGRDLSNDKVGLVQKLDIIDPDNIKGENSPEGSALSAMESFIKKSFTNKFDYKKGNIIISPHTSADATIHQGPLATSGLGFENMDYLNRYKNFYAALNLNNGFKHELSDSEKDGNSRHTTKNGIKSKHEKDAGRSVKSSTARTQSDDDKEDGRNSVKSATSDSSGVLDKADNLETKYLTMDDAADVKTEKDAKSSALDNLSSFVYGQTLTSEHPLDSLQKLITKSDIPKLMATHAASGRFKYLPPHLQMHQANLDLTLPLNLSVKSPKAESDEDETRSRPDEDSLSDYEALASPANSDGEPIEYRCAACSRRFASKGSYRYHLSRCHLSSVKKYGIKEAFNMSPYVYLPLDHTAKFSKYYEMAKELANKAKENRAKSN